MRLAHVDGTRPDDFGDFKKPAWILRKAWQLTGRYIDVSRINEGLQRVGLKRLLGMLGLDIIESDKLINDTTIHNLEELADLFAYNVSDVVNLQHLFEHPVYQNGFNVRAKLLETYPQTIYAQKREPAKRLPNGEMQEPQVDTGNYMNIRRDRLARDSTSAKFAEWRKQGEMGRKKLAQVTRYGTIVLAFIQAIAVSIGFNAMAGGQLIEETGFFNILIIAIVLTAGTAFLMWLGEQITAHGVGNGISIIIFAGIVAAVPNGVKQLYSQYFMNPGDDLFINIVIVALILLVALAVTVGSFTFNKLNVKFRYNMQKD